MTNISEDCPHREQLEHTLLQCQTQSEMLQATRDNYLSIIVEFQRDLEELTAQVEQQQQQQEQHYEEPPQIATTELELQNERLLCQINNLQGILTDREQQIKELRSMLTGYTDITETNRLKDEISALKQKNSEQNHKVCDIASLLKSEEEERHKLCVKYETLMNSSDKQRKELRHATREVQNLHDRLIQMGRLQDELETERTLLREEVVALKVKEASSNGRERALNDQLKSCQVELDKARCLLREMQTYLKAEQRQHMENIERLQRENEEVRQQLRALSDECTKLQLKLKQQTEINEQQDLIIESFRKWKAAQVRSDAAMRQCVHLAESHISTLIEENKRLCGEYRGLYDDYFTLDKELMRVTNSVNSRATAGSDPATDTGVQKRRQIHQEMENRMRTMTGTSERITAQIQELNMQRHRLREDHLQQKKLHAKNQQQGRSPSPPGPVQ